jgi:cyclophilin family peptidyl-prolyl cis-trans isomerase
MTPRDRKHGRDAARRRAAQAAARQVARQRTRRLQLGVGGAVALVVVLAVALATFAGGSDDTDDVDTESTSSSSPSTTVDAFGVISDDPEGSTSPAFEYGKGECPPAEKPATPKRTFTAAPKRCLDDDVDYQAKVETNQGTFVIDLLEHRAPGTVNNFVVLAKWGFFDGLTFHRVVKDFVNQAGDPEGTGSGGPGYAIADELPAAVSSYSKWAVAMANSGPGTNGSQWFTCIDCSKLPTPGYSLFGQVTDGTDVVQKINDLAQADDTPSTPVVISSITILEA